MWIFVDVECDGTGEPNIEPQVSKITTTPLLIMCVYIPCSLKQGNSSSMLYGCSLWSGLVKIRSVRTVKVLAIQFATSATAKQPHNQG